MNRQDEANDCAAPLGVSFFCRAADGRRVGVLVNRADAGCFTLTDDDGNPPGVDLLLMVGAGADAARRRRVEQRHGLAPGAIAAGLQRCGLVPVGHAAQRGVSFVCTSAQGLRVGVLIDGAGAGCSRVADDALNPPGIDRLLIVGAGADSASLQSLEQRNGLAAGAIAAGLWSCRLVEAQP